EDLEVTRDRRQAHRERLRQLVHGRLALGEAGQDRPARRVGKCGEGEVELVGWHVTDGLINVSIKYHLLPRSKFGRGARHWCLWGAQTRLSLNRAICSAIEFTHPTGSRRRSRTRRARTLSGVMRSGAQAERAVAW